jgi:hypothetical protein
MAFVILLLVLLAALISEDPSVSPLHCFLPGNGLGKEGVKRLYLRDLEELRGRELVFAGVVILKKDQSVGARLTSQTSRYNLMSTLALLLVVLIPFNAPVLAVWGRNIWADWRNPFPGDWDAIRILPLLTLVWLCVSGRPIKPRYG